MNWAEFEGKQKVSGPVKFCKIDVFSLVGAESYVHESKINPVNP